MAAIAGLGLILAGSWLAVGGRAKRSGCPRRRACRVTAPVQEACAAVESPAPVAATAHVEG